VPAPLGKERSESEPSQRGPQYGHLGSDHANSRWLSGVAEAADLVYCRANYGGCNCEYGGGGEYRPATISEPEKGRE
jgi:hypothetical protein